MTNAEWQEREEAFHREMSELYRDQVLRAIQNRDAYRDLANEGEAWKNRTRISAKLTPEHYATLMAYCRENEYSVNTALRTILETYFASHHE